MKRKFSALILTAVLFVQLLLPVYAGGTDGMKTEIKAAYWNNDMLYTFAQIEPEEQNASLIVNNQQIWEGTPAKLADTGAVVHYMLLVDTSNSMGWCRNSIISFAQKLMQSNQNVKMTIARFDRSFSVVGADLTDWENVKESLESLTFHKDGSDINGSAAAALEYLGATKYDAELVNLVVITDGEPWYSNDGNLEEQLESEANQKVAALMEVYPEIFVHTLSFLKWQAAADAVYSGNNGLHFAQCPAEEAADALIGFVDSLYGIFVPLKGYQGIAQIPDDMMLRVGMNFISYDRVRNSEMVPEIEVDISQEHIPEETLAPEEPTVPDTTEPVQPETIPPETEEATEPALTEETAANAPAVDTAENETAAIAGIVIGIVVLLAVAIVVFAVAKKRKLQSNSVRIKIKLLAGKNIRVKEIYYLSDEIRIGGDKKCDIIIPENNGTVSFRIIKQDQLIYIEDMTTSDGILLNGMRLFAPNRLRSGDVITAGTVVMQVLF